MVDNLGDLLVGAFPFFDFFFGGLEVGILEDEEIAEVSEVSRLISLGDRRRSGALWRLELSSSSSLSKLSWRFMRSGMISSSSSEVLIEIGRHQGVAGVVVDLGVVVEGVVEAQQCDGHGQCDTFVSTVRLMTADVDDETSDVDDADDVVVVEGVRRVDVRCVDGAIVIDGAVVLYWRFIVVIKIGDFRRFCTGGVILQEV